jgi:hypothetical protein
MITLRDGRDQVKFPSTCGKPTTFRAKCERPLQSVMNFGSAALAAARDRLLKGSPIRRFVNPIFHTFVGL